MKTGSSTGVRGSDDRELAAKRVGEAFRRALAGAESTQQLFVAVASTYEFRADISAQVRQTIVRSRAARERARALRDSASATRTTSAQEHEIALGVLDAADGLAAEVPARKAQIQAA